MHQEEDNKKRIAKNTIMLYIRMLFSILVSLVTSRLVLNILGVENYGIYNVVGGVVMLFTFLNTAMSASTQRFLTFELGRGNKVRLQQIFSASIIIHILISLFVFLLAESCGLWLFYNKMVIPIDKIEVAMWVYQLSVLSCVVAIMSVPYNAAIIAREKMSVFAYISMLDIFLRLVVVCSLYFIPFNKLKVYAILLLCVSLLIRGVYVYYCKKNIKEVHFSFIWNKSLFKEMLHFAGWNLMGNMAFIAYTQGTNILLNMFFGPTVNAARAVAIQLQSVVNNFCNSFQTALNPQITKSFAMGKKQYMHTLVFSSSKYSFLLLLLLSLPLLIETEQILTLWLKIVPKHTVSFLRIILLVTMIDVMANPLITSAQATGRIRNYQIIVGGILLFILPISYVVLKLGGKPEYVFLVHLCVAIAAQIARLYLSHSLINISIRHYWTKVIIPLIKVFGFAILFPLLLYYIFDVSLLRLLLVIIFSCISVLIGGYMFVLEPNEKTFIKSKYVSLRKKYHDSDI